MDDALQTYLDGIAPEHRPLFDRLQRLILEVHPDAEVGIAYQMPSYKVGKRRVSLGVWQHGLSIYGWRENQDVAFLARHPELKTGKGTIKLGPGQAEAISDDEFRGLFAGALEP
jgi:uncharacterized protein YdhG (YjbR/CyaY superfamily)